MPLTRTILIILLALILTACGVSPGSGVNPQAIQQLYDEHTLCDEVSYANLLWSEDSSHIYYTYVRQGVGEVRSINVDGMGETTVIKDATLSSISPDGRLILFEQSALQTEVYDVVNVNTWTVLNQKIWSSSWSSDSRWLKGVIPSEGIVKVNVSTGEVIRLMPVGDHTAFRSLYWSSDGESFAFGGEEVGATSIYLVDLDTAEVRQLTDSSQDTCKDTNFHELMAWLPDGETLAYKRNCETGEGISLVSISGNDLGNWASPYDGSKINLAWSPDSQSALFTSYDWAGLPGYSVMVANADGSNVRVLMPDAFYGVWSPDSQKIALLVGDFNSIKDIWVINADGTNPHRVTNNPGHQHTCWH